jgi:hypothetical protein
MLEDAFALGMIEGIELALGLKEPSKIDSENCYKELHSLADRYKRDYKEFENT